MMIGNNEKNLQDDPRAQPGAVFRHVGSDRHFLVLMQARGDGGMTHVVCRSPGVKHAMIFSLLELVSRMHAAPVYALVSGISADKVKLAIGAEDLKRRLPERDKTEVGYVVGMTAEVLPGRPWEVVGPYFTGFENGPALAWSLNIDDARIYVHRYQAEHVAHQLQVQAKSEETQLGVREAWRFSPANFPGIGQPDDQHEDFEGTLEVYPGWRVGKMEEIFPTCLEFAKLKRANWKCPDNEHFALEAAYQYGATSIAEYPEILAITAENMVNLMAALGWEHRAPGGPACINPACKEPKPEVQEPRADYDTWLLRGVQLHQQHKGSEVGLRHWIAEFGDARGCRERWASFGNRDRELYRLPDKVDFVICRCGSHTPPYMYVAGTRRVEDPEDTSSWSELPENAMRFPTLDHAQQFAQRNIPAVKTYIAVIPPKE